MARILCIDYGTKRSGLAATDILQIAVHSLETIPTGLLWEWLETYLINEPVEKVVIGHPTHSDGNAVHFMDQIKGLMRKIEKKFPSVKVELHDEAYTSVRAKEVILQSGVKKEKRKDKKLVDKIAAVLILQDYLGH